MVYVGQAGSGDQRLFGRLKQHKRDALAGRWNQFSWFGTRRVLGDGNLSVEVERKQSTTEEILNHIEAILIHASEPKHNRQGGRFGENVGQYLQTRSEFLGPTTDEMIHELWRNSK